jgi:hypothetical protein
MVKCSRVHDVWRGWLFVDRALEQGRFGIGGCSTTSASLELDIVVAGTIGYAKLNQISLHIYFGVDDKGYYNGID